jgi:hypothetical protein
MFLNRSSSAPPWASLVQLDCETSSPTSTDVADDHEKLDLAADGPEKIGAEIRCDPSFPMRKRKLPNVISVAFFR